MLALISIDACWAYMLTPFSLFEISGAYVSTPS
jgi:hypothetical protein